MPDNFNAETTKEAITEAIQWAMKSRWALLVEEVQFRARVYTQTQDLNLASSGSRWATEMNRSDLASATPEQVIDLARLVLGGELCRRMYDADVCIPDSLFVELSRSPGVPVWTQKKADGDGLFHLGKAWAVTEAVGLELHVMVAEFVQEAFACAQ